MQICSKIRIHLICGHLLISFEVSSGCTAVVGLTKINATGLLNCMDRNYKLSLKRNTREKSYETKIVGVY